MRKEHVQFLVCPSCRGELELSEIREEGAQGIKSGLLRCSRCRSSYPVIRHIPRFVPEQNYASGFGLQWTVHARTQYDSYTGVPISETRFFEETQWPRRLDGERVLEVGCGSGRFTVHAASTGALVVSMDYSNAVDANFAANGDRPNLLIVQSDLYHLPFQLGSVDRIFCFGVLQHTPDVHRSFRAIEEGLKPGGHLVVDVYRKPQGLKRLVATKYWVRPISRRVPPHRLYSLTRAYVRLMWPVARMVSRIPRIGKKLNWMLLIADYRGVYPLAEHHLKEWAILDTFDMLAPAYDQPQTLEAIQRWFDDAKFSDIDVHYGFNGIEGRGRKGLTV